MFIAEIKLPKGGKMSGKEWLLKVVGQDLTGFKIVEMTEVFRVDNDGRKAHSLGFFRDPNVATAFAGAQTDACWHETHQCLVLTNGTVGWVIKEQEPVKMFDDEQEAVELKKKAIAKLSPAERALLGFSD